jgi:hypothetical protein
MKLIAVRRDDQPIARMSLPGQHQKTHLEG